MRVHVQRFLLLQMILSFCPCVEKLNNFISVHCVFCSLGSKRCPNNFMMSPQVNWGLICLDMILVLTARWQHGLRKQKRVLQHLKTVIETLQRKQTVLTSIMSEY